MGSLSTLVTEFEAGRSTPGRAQDLRDLFLRHVDRVTRRYPDAYFELGCRSDDAVEGLADRALTVCAAVAKGRFPFMGRVPFRAFVEEAFDDPPIRYHSFYARLSVARELLRDDYAFNLRRDPVLRWRDQLHRDIGAALKARAQAVDDGGGGHQRWRIDARGPTVVRHLDDVRDALAPVARDLSVDDLVHRALTLAGQPLAHSVLSNLLGDVLGGPPDEVPPEAPAPASLPEALTLRRAVLGAWQELSEPEQALVTALARGDSYDDLIARVPAFRDRSAVSRAVRACGERFVARIVRDLGEDPTGGAATPKQVLELVAAVVLPLVGQEAS